MSEKAIVFGVGMKLEELRIRGVFSDDDIIAYSDNNAQTWGSVINGKRVIPPSEIAQNTYDVVYISTEQYFDEIKKQLVEQYGIPQEKIKRFSVPKDKYEGEIAFWKALYQKNGCQFDSEAYRNKILSIAHENDDSFWKGKVVVDFGCGPAGSLAWTKTPAVKIGVDVLADRYLRAFGDELVGQDMIYVTSSEKHIPVPDHYADYLLTINSLDHVDNLDEIISELMRILKPNGVLLASFNINEMSTECEPQMLTEEKLHEKLLKHFHVDSYELRKMGRVNDIGEEQAILYIKATRM